MDAAAHEWIPDPYLIPLFTLWSVSQPPEGFGRGFQSPWRSLPHDVELFHGSRADEDSCSSVPPFSPAYIYALGQTRNAAEDGKSTVIMWNASPRTVLFFYGFRLRMDV